MKAVLLISLLVVAASAAPQPDKRFISEFPQTSDSNTFNEAENTFNSLTQGLNGIDVNFDVVVNALIPVIDSEMTQVACTAVCVGAAGTVLGPAALLAPTVCGPVCKAALAQLEEAAG